MVHNWHSTKNNSTFISTFRHIAVKLLLRHHRTLYCESFKCVVECIYFIHDSDSEAYVCIRINRLSSDALFSINKVQLYIYDFTFKIFLYMIL